MSQAMDMVLGKSEKLVDRFLPMTEAELVQPIPAQGNLELKPRLDFSLHYAPQKVRHSQPQRHMGLLHMMNQSQTGGPENCFIRLGDVLFISCNFIVLKQSFPL